MGKIYFLSVGRGNFTIIQSTNGSTVLIDCGDDNQTSYRFDHLLPDNRIIDAVCVTHQHFDHFRQLKYFLENNYRIEKLIYPPYVRKKNDPSVTEDEWNCFQEYLAALENAGTRLIPTYRPLTFGDPILEID